MRTRAPARWAAVALGATLVASAATAIPSLASASPKWVFSLGTSPGSPYRYRVDTRSYGEYASEIRATSSVSAEATRRMSRHVSLVTSASYRGYRGPIGLASVPETPPSTGHLRAEIFSLGAGLHFEPGAGNRRGVQPYAQFVPGLYHARWEERVVDHEGFDMISGTWRSRSVSTDALRSLAPGFAAGVGARAWLSSVLAIDAGMRLTRTAEPGEQSLGRYSSGSFLGLDQTELVAGLAWSP